MGQLGWSSSLVPGDGRLALSVPLHVQVRRQLIGRVLRSLFGGRLRAGREGRRQGAGGDFEAGSLLRVGPVVGLFIAPLN
jgi:hypothetical protein